MCRHTSLDAVGHSSLGVGNVGISVFRGGFTRYVPKALRPIHLVDDGGSEQVDEDLLPLVVIVVHLLLSGETAAGEGGRTALFPRAPCTHLLHLFLHLDGKHLTW